MNLQQLPDTDEDTQIRCFALQLAVQAVANVKLQGEVGVGTYSAQVAEVFLGFIKKGDK